MMPQWPYIYKRSHGITQISPKYIDRLNFALAVSAQFSPAGSPQGDLHEEAAAGLELQPLPANLRYPEEQRSGLRSGSKWLKLGSTGQILLRLHKQVLPKEATAQQIKNRA